MFKENIQAKDIPPYMVKQRIHRAYPSLVRDYHFFHILKESGKFDNVMYSLRQDVAEGIDLQVEKNGRKFFLSLFVETDNSHKYRRIKEDRYGFPIYHVPMGIKLGDGNKKCGFVYLYDDRHVNVLEKTIEATCKIDN